MKFRHANPEFAKYNLLEPSERLTSSEMLNKWTLMLLCTNKRQCESKNREIVEVAICISQMRKLSSRKGRWGSEDHGKAVARLRWNSFRC